MSWCHLWRHLRKPVRDISVAPLQGLPLLSIDPKNYASSHCGSNTAPLVTLYFLDLQGSVLEYLILAYKLLEFSSRNCRVSWIWILKWNLISGARTHSSRSKLTGPERRAPSNRLSNGVQIPPLEAKVSRVGNHKQEAWNSPFRLRQLKSGRETLTSNSSRSPNTSVEVRKDLAEPVKISPGLQIGKAENCPLGREVNWQHVLNAEDGPPTVPGSVREVRGGERL